MSQTTEQQKKPEYNVIPVQMGETEFEKFILPHLSLPKRGPDCKIGYHKTFNYILDIGENRPLGTPFLAAFFAFDDKVSESGGARSFV